MPSRARNVLLGLFGALIPVMLVAGIWIGGHPSTLPSPLRSVFVDEKTRTLEEALDIIEDDYYRRVDRDRLVDDGLKGTVGKLNDRFSAYLDPKEYDRFQDASSGNFSGIGLEVAQIPQGLRVAKVFPGTPAARAGFRKDDRIVAVNGRSIAGKPSSVSTQLIRGKPGTFVSLTVVSGARRSVKRVARAIVESPAVTAAIRKVRGVPFGVVTLASFSAGAHGELRAAINRQLKGGAKGIVLDLRGNGGGLLTESVLVASIFIPDGKIVTTRGRSKPEKVYSATGSAIDRRIPVVVLVDDTSASASEIVTGALQDRGRAKIVGTNTFGKGVFQEVRELPNGGALDITVGEYFLPSGRNIGGGGPKRGKGISPDVRARDRVGTPADEALDVALAQIARVVVTR